MFEGNIQIVAKRNSGIDSCKSAEGRGPQELSRIMETHFVVAEGQ
jgi:hypothetical protein